VTRIFRYFHRRARRVIIRTILSLVLLAFFIRIVLLLLSLPLLLNIATMPDGSGGGGGGGGGGLGLLLTEEEGIQRFFPEYLSNMVSVPEL
jgi:hypothetical protein